MKIKRAYLILATILVLVGTFLALQQFALVGTGYSVLSIDRPNVESEDDDLSKLNWLVTVRMGGADQVKFQLDDEFEQQTGLPTEKPFIVEADSLDETLKYSIMARDDFFFNKYDVVTVQERGAAENPTQACPSADYIITYDAPIISIDQAICINEIQIGRYGDISQPTRKTEAELTISNGEKQDTQIIGSDKTSAAFVIDNEEIATASWQGSLVSGNPDPTVPDVAVLGDFTDDRWRFISDANFNSYKNAQEDFVRQLRTVDTYEDTFGKQIFDILLPGSQEYDANDFERLSNEIQNKAENINSNVDIYLRDYSLIDNSFNIRNANSQEEAYLEFESDVSLSFPVITFWIRADYLGVQRLAGEPNILEASSRSFGSEEQGTVNLRVENEGGALGYFNAYLKDCDSFTTTTTANQFTVPAGQIGAYALNIDAGSQDRDIEETCTICVHDTNQPTNEDCRDTTLRFDATTICTPDEYTIKNNNIVQCNSDGTEFEVVARCGTKEAKYTGEGQYDGYECFTEITLAECQDGEDNDNDGQIDMNDTNCDSPRDDSEQEQPKECAVWDIECQIKQFFTTALPIIGLLFAIFVTGFTGIQLRQRFKKKEQLFFVIMISLGIGVASYFLFKKYWWVFLIIMVILSIWIGFVKGKTDLIKKGARKVMRR